MTRPASLQKIILVFALSVYLVGFIQPEENDLLELKAGLFARSEAKFRDGIDEKTKIGVLPKDAKGIVRKVKYFTNPDGQPNGNSGVCVEFVTGLPSSFAKKDCYWVYFNKRQAALKLFGLAKNDIEKEKILKQWKAGQSPPAAVSTAPSPQPAQLAVTQRPVASINDAAIEIVTYANQAVNSNPLTNSADSSRQARTTPGSRISEVNRQENSQVVRTIIRVNDNVNGTAMQPNLGCPDGTCNRQSLIVGESCSKENSYNKQAILELIANGAQGEYFKSPQKEIITRQCVSKNMQAFSKSSAFYNLCLPGQASGGKKVPRACIDDDYLNVTSKAFNLSADCLGDYVVGYPVGSFGPFKDGATASKAVEGRNIIISAKQQAALSIFSFMAQESGMHINAQSYRGAGGPGQMTQGAVADVNNDLKNIRTHLMSRSDNPSCAKVLLPALQKPFMAQGQSCDRKDAKNILQSMAYTFAYQAFIRRTLEDTVFDKNVFGRLLSKELSVQEKDRFMMELSAWAHNTGAGGMTKPLAALMTRYTREGRKIKNSDEVDRFLKELSPEVYKHSPSYASEHANYYQNIQRKMAEISPGGKAACLAN